MAVTFKEVYATSFDFQDALDHPDLCVNARKVVDLAYKVPGKPDESVKTLKEFPVTDLQGRECFVLEECGRQRALRYQLKTFLLLARWKEGKMATIRRQRQEAAAKRAAKKQAAARATANIGALSAQPSVSASTSGVAAKAAPGGVTTLDDVSEEDFAALILLVIRFAPRDEDLEEMIEWATHEEEAAAAAEVED